MNHTLAIAITLALAALGSAMFTADSVKPIIRVFYKNKKPSQKTLVKINETLDNFRDLYEIHYHDIEDEINRELIQSLGLPSTHFPVAVVIEGKFTAKFGDRIASFVHFPDFMHGIGRHEGNWSIADLEAALQNNALLLEENILPEIAEGETEGECE